MLSKISLNTLSKKLSKATLGKLLFTTAIIATPLYVAKAAPENPKLASTETVKTEAPKTEFNFQKIFSLYIDLLKNSAPEKFAKVLDNSGLNKLCYNTRREEPEFDGSEYSDYLDIVYGQDISYDCKGELSADKVVITGQNPESTLLLNSTLLGIEGQKQVAFDNAVFYTTGEPQKFKTEIQAHPDFKCVEDDGKLYLEHDNYVGWVTVESSKPGLLKITIERGY